MLDGIERVGNKVPHPAIIFLGLIVCVIVLSAVLAGARRERHRRRRRASPPVPVDDGVRRRVGRARRRRRRSTTTPSHEFEIVTGDHRSAACSAAMGSRFIFTSFVNNFAGFSVVAVMFVAMIGVGVAEEAGLMAALIRKLRQVARRRRSRSSSSWSGASRASRPTPAT